MTTRINLMPVECRRTFEQRRQATLWTACCIIVLVVLLVLQQVIDLFIGGLGRQLDTARSLVANLDQTNGEMLQQRTTIASIQKRLDLSAELERADVPLALLQIVGDSCYTIGSSIHLDSLRMDETSAPSSDNSITVPTFYLTLVGSGDTDDSVSTFVALLQASKVFRQVELQSSQAQNDQRFSQRSFQIRCAQ